MSAKKLKVYGGLTAHRWRLIPQVRTIVAATSMVEVARLVGCPLNEVRTYWGQTFNDHEIRTAMAKPRVVFKAKAGGSCREFEEGDMPSQTQKEKR